MRSVCKWFVVCVLVWGLQACSHKTPHTATHANDNATQTHSIGQNALESTALDSSTPQSTTQSIPQDSTAPQLSKAESKQLASTLNPSPSFMTQDPTPSLAPQSHNPLQTAIECDDLCQAITKRTIASRQKSGKYIGLGVGVNLLNSTQSDTNLNFNINNNTKSPYAQPIILPAFGVRVGNVSFFNRYIGVRGFFGFDMGFGAHSGKLTMLSVGIDAIIEAPIHKHKNITLGILLGMGADAYIYFDKRDHRRWSRMKKAGEVFMQVGITTMLGVHNRVNLVYRFLPARRASYFSPTGIFSLEYAFKF